MIPWWWLIPAVVIGGGIVMFISGAKCNECLHEQYVRESKRVKKLNELTEAMKELPGNLDISDPPQGGSGVPSTNHINNQSGRTE